VVTSRITASADATIPLKLASYFGLLIGVQRGRGSDLDLTAVDEELDAVDEARLIRRQEQHRLGDLFGLADAAGGMRPAR
jgi:hypothetical protein